MKASRAAICSSVSTSDMASRCSSRSDCHASRRSSRESNSWSRLHVGIEGFAQLGQSLALFVAELPAVDQNAQALLHVLTALAMLLLAHFALGRVQVFALLLVEDLVHPFAVLFVHLSQGLHVLAMGFFKGAAGLLVEAGTFEQFLAALLEALLALFVTAFVLVGRGDGRQRHGRDGHGEQGGHQQVADSVTTHGGTPWRWVDACSVVRPCATNLHQLCNEQGS